MTGVYNLGKMSAFVLEDFTLFGLVGWAFVGSQILGGGVVSPLLNREWGPIGVLNSNSTVWFGQKIWSTLTSESISYGVVTTFGQL